MIMLLQMTLTTTTAILMTRTRIVSWSTFLNLAFEYANQLLREEMFYLWTLIYILNLVLKHVEYKLYLNSKTGK
jgi:hypothetical protein